MLSRPASHALLAALRGVPPAPAPDAQLRARAADGDAGAVQALADHAQAAPCVALATAARAREHAQVELADTTTLSLDDAERLLAAKEERAPHRVLRQALERTVDEYRYFEDCRIETAPAALIDAFLAGTAGVASAALEALEQVGGGAVDDAASLAWALDLPSSSFELARAMALLAAARAAAGVPLACVRVPRALAGLVVVVEQAKLCVPDAGFRADRWCRVVNGGAEVLAAARPASGSMQTGFGLGAVLPAVLRQVGYGRVEAERVCRIASARALLLTRARAALAVSGWPDALERVTTRSIRPTNSLRELLDPGPAGRDATSLTSELNAAAAAMALRDAWDEAFFVSGRAWQEPPEPAATPPWEAWRAWLGPWL